MPPLRCVLEPSFRRLLPVGRHHWFHRHGHQGRTSPKQYGSLPFQWQETWAAATGSRLASPGCGQAVYSGVLFPHRPANIFRVLLATSQVS